MIRVLLPVLFLAPAGATAELSPDGREFFEKKIRPILVEQCYECHATEADEIKGDYTLDTRQGLRRGGASGKPAVVPGKPGQSRLLQALRYEHEDLEMPPDEPLSSQVVADFERWIAMGAPDPRDQDPEQLRQKARAKQAEGYWAFRDPLKPAPPEVNHSDWPRQPLDRFILARLEAKGLEPGHNADRAALLRRLYFDLIGLPPAPEELEAFLNDNSAQAYAKVVNRLLASPRFGERWGRHWLDVARYAESSGKEFNFTYPHAWPYRDYVINAFNQDKPYNQFILEQIAGDLLPAESRRQRDEQRLATGFLAVGPKRHNAGRSTFKMDMVDDQITTTSQAFMGLTVGCARCHDHKFDPIPTEDYYAMAGIFLSTETLYGTEEIKYSRHPADLIPFGPDAEELDQAYQAHRKKVKETEEKLEKAKKELEEAEKKKKDQDKEKDKEKENGDKKNSKDEGKEVPLEKQIAQAKKNVSDLEKRVKKLKNETPPAPKYAMGAREGEKPEDAKIAIGGNPRKRGDRVPRGFLSAVNVADAPEIGEDESGRLALARWISSTDNPLTARVMVNRIWQHLFGEGLVATVDNFGALGKEPTHPKLLDHLAVNFMEQDWSVKRMIRTIVLSRTYQLSTQFQPENYAVDPENKLYWRMSPRRLEVEPLRDAILAASGRLDLGLPDGSPVTQLGQQLARKPSYEKLNPESRLRTVYLPVVRHYLPHMLQEFDFAASSLVVGDRPETTVPAQALFLLNSEFMLENGRAMAQRLIDAEPKDPGARIDLAYRLALSRSPKQAEIETALDYVQRCQSNLAEEVEDKAERRLMAWSSFAQALLASAEFRYLIEPPVQGGPSLANLNQE